MVTVYDLIKALKSSPSYKVSYKLIMIRKINGEFCYFYKVSNIMEIVDVNGKWLCFNFTDTRGTINTGKFLNGTIVETVK